MCLSVSRKRGKSTHTAFSRQQFCCVCHHSKQGEAELGRRALLAQSDHELMYEKQFPVFGPNRNRHLKVTSTLDSFAVLASLGVCKAAGQDGAQFN